MRVNPPVDTDADNNAGDFTAGSLVGFSLPAGIRQGDGAGARGPLPEIPGQFGPYRF